MSLEELESPSRPSTIKHPDNEFMLLKERITFLRGRLATLKEQADKTHEAWEAATLEAQDTVGSRIFLQFVAEKLNQNSEVQVSKLSTLALREVFDNHTLSLEATHSNIRNGAGTILKLKDHRREIEGDPCEAFGGGPVSLLNVILRIISVIKQKGLARILFLDEPLGAVSARYQENTAKLMRKLCEPTDNGGLGFTIFMVTHNPIYTSAAHKAYRVTSDPQNHTLVLKDLSTEEIDPEP